MSPWHATAPSSSEAKEHSTKNPAKSINVFAHKRAVLHRSNRSSLIQLSKTSVSPALFVIKKVLSIRESELLNLFIYALHSYVYCCNLICAVEHFAAYVFRNVLG